MIQINTFDPFMNWTRSSYEFLDEKVVIHSRSTKADRQFEVNYKDIKVIETRFITYRIGYTLSFYLVIIISAINSFFECAIAANPFLQLVLKAGLILGIFAAFFIFYVKEFYGFLDKDRNYLGYITVNKKNHTQAQEALQLIRQKAELFSDTTTNQKAKQTALFELSTLDIPDFVNKSVTRFYEDRLVDTEKSLTEELVTEIKYDELSGKTQIIQHVNLRWDNVWGYSVFLWFATWNFFLLFFPQFIKTLPSREYLFWGSFLFLLPLYLIKFIKYEAICFYNTNNEVIYFNWISAKNREKIKQIVAFIQQKTGYNPEQD